jgi:hypothetical protein
MATALGVGASAAAMADYWAVANQQLHEHHVLEDSVIWPLMRDRLGPSVDALLDSNADEHRAMAAAMMNFGVALAGMTTSKAARTALADLDDAVETHLAHEEAGVLPLIPQAFDVDDVAFFTAEAGKTNPPSAFLPWLLENAPPTDLSYFTVAMPPGLRAELEGSWLPAWQQKVDALHPTAAAAGWR